MNKANIDALQKLIDLYGHDAVQQMVQHAKQRQPKISSPSNTMKPPQTARSWREFRAYAFYVTMDEQRMHTYKVAYISYMLNRDIANGVYIIT